MSAVPINLVIEQGDTFEVTFNLRNSFGTFINLSSYSVEAKMAKNYTNTSTQYNLNPTIIDPSTGLIQLTIPAVGGQLVTKTQDIPEGRYVYNIRITKNAPPLTEKVIEGIVTVKGSVL
jgi:hypothetical protein